MVQQNRDDINDQKMVRRQTISLFQKHQNIHNELIIKCLELHRDNLILISRDLLIQQKYNKIYGILTQNVTISHLINSHSLKMESYKMIGKYLQLFGDYRKSNLLLKEWIMNCNKTKQLGSKFNAYFEIVENYKSLKDEAKQQIYLKKLLVLSWFMNDKTSELKAYDLIGKIYFG